MRINQVVSTSLLWAAAIACGGGDGDGGDVDAAATDAPTDGDPSLPRCHGATPFGAPVLAPALAAVNTSAGEAGARLSADQRTIVLTVDGVLHSSTRAGPQDAFPAPAPVAIPDLAGDAVGSPSLTADGQTLYFTRRVATSFAIWKAPRASDGTLGTPVAIAELDAPGTDEVGAYILPDESAIYYSDRTHIVRAERQASGTFLPAAEVASLVGGPNELTVAITPDELIAVVGSSLGNMPSGHVQMFHRTARDQPFGAPVEVANEFLTSWIAPDGCTLYVVGRYNAGTQTTDIWQATRAPQ